jgi:type IV pilus assembly protein PilF
MNGMKLKAWSVLVPIFLIGCASSVERQADMEREQKMVDVNLQLGSEYFRRGQLDFAIEKFSKALKINPDHSQANNLMAILKWRLKEYDEAERHFRRAVKTETGNPAAHHNYGAFLCDRGKIKKAVEYLEKAALDPLYDGTAEAYQNAGICLMKKPAPMEAEKYFRSALAINSKLPSALYEMAKISFDTGRTHSARGFIQRYFHTADDTPESLWLAVRIERALKNKDEAASYAVRLRGKFPNSPEAIKLQSERTSHRAR